MYVSFGCNSAKECCKDEQLSSTVAGVTVKNDGSEANRQSNWCCQVLPGDDAFHERKAAESFKKYGCASGSGNIFDK